MHIYAHRVHTTHTLGTSGSKAGFERHLSVQLLLPMHLLLPVQLPLPLYICHMAIPVSPSARGSSAGGSGHGAAGRAVNRLLVLQEDPPG